jgi:hypothetical protein
MSKADLTMWLFASHVLAQVYDSARTAANSHSPFFFGSTSDDHER